MIKSHSRGHEIIFENNKWVYADNLKSIEIERKCVRCGKYPTKEGYDFCLGYLSGATSVCCGHGVAHEINLINKKDKK